MPDKSDELVSALLLEHAAVEADRLAMEADEAGEITFDESMLYIEDVYAAHAVVEAILKYGAK